MAITLTGAAPIAVPSSSAVATKANYVSSTDLQKSEVGESLVARYGAQGLTGLMDFVGAKSATGSGKYSHWEERFIHDTFTATLVASTGVLSLVEVASGKDAPVRKGDILLGAGGQNLIVTTKNSADADAFTVLTADGVALADISTAISFSIVGNAHAQGTGQPVGLTPSVDQYTNNTQIIKDAYDVTGSGATDVSWFKVEGGYLWYLKGEADSALRFGNYAELQMLIGPGGNAALDTSDIRITRGLLPDIRSNGNVMSGGGNFGITEMDIMVKQMDKQRGAKENAFMCGIDLALNIDDQLAAASGAGSNVSYGAFNNSKDTAINLGFGGFTRGGYSFHKKTYDIFNHPMLLGAVNYAGKGIVIPMDKQKDAKSGAMIPSLQVRFKAAGNYSREMEHWLTGGAVLAQKTDDIDALKCNYRCEKGFEGMALNRFVLVD
tara:strand:- start:1859 stop:3169 length:1311 start_codon:yes stop_codon:yes gene_type:complete